jgi:hypothetical protein
VNVTSLVRYRCYRAVPQLRWLVAGFPMRRPRFDPRSFYVGFLVDEMALGQVFFEYLDFPCQFLFHQLLYNRLSSGAGTIGQKAKYWLTYQVDSVSPHPKKLKKKISILSGEVSVRFDLKPYYFTLYKNVSLLKMRILRRFITTKNSCYLSELLSVHSNRHQSPPQF